MKKQTAQLTSDRRANHIYARGKVWNDIIQANADSAGFSNAWPLLQTSGQKVFYDFMCSA